MMTLMRRMSQRAFDARARYIVALASLVLTLLAASRRTLAGTVRDDRDPQLYLNLGADPRYASVGKFDLTKWEPGFSASGTLVGTDWVLTAAHVMEGATTGQFTVGGQAYSVSKWVTHPKWDGELRRGYDLALVKLDRDVAGVAPASLYTGKKEFGALATFVGFGRTGTGLTGDTAFDALKRAGQNIIDGSIGKEQWPLNATFHSKLPKNARTFLVDFDNPHNAADSQVGASSPVDLEYLISLGDSGGGAFVDSGKGPLLAGVHSFAEVPDGVDDSDYGDVIGDVRVSAHAKWIRSVLKKDQKAEAAALRAALRGARGRGRELPPELIGLTATSATAVPEPATPLLLLLPAAAVLRRPRRSAPRP
jgi:hypothetical protein